MEPFHHSLQQSGNSITATVLSTCSVAGVAVPGSPWIQALLDALTLQWEDISNAGLELLSDLHFATQ